MFLSVFGIFGVLAEIGKVLVSWCSGVMTDLGPTISETGPWSLDWAKVQIGQETGVGEIVCLGGYQWS